MMRYLIIFLFLTSCFKNALENCADEKIKSASIFNRTEITKTVKLTNDEMYQKELMYQNTLKELNTKYPDRFDCTDKINEAVNIYKLGIRSLITRDLNESNIKKYQKACSDRLEYGLKSHFAKVHKKVETKSIPIKKVSMEENLQNYKKFIRKNLKEKMRDSEYEKLYQQCVDMKKNEPEIFKAKFE